MSSANPAEAPKTIRRLHKPPTVATIHTPPERPRKRLQKRHTAPTPSQTQLHQFQVQHATRSKKIFLLEYEPYPLTSSNSEILGVYSTIDTVTAGAFRHGAYAFSKEGVVAGSEYLSASGRIKIRVSEVQKSGPSAVIAERSVMETGEVVRLDIPHPAALEAGAAGSPPGSTCQTASRGSTGERWQGDGKAEVGRPRQVFLALHQSAQSVFCIGVFTTKPLAWGACLKDKAWLASTDELEDEQRGVREGNCPELSVRVKGGARQKWYVRVIEVDAHVAMFEDASGESAPNPAAPQVQPGLQLLEGIPLDVARFRIARKDVRPMPTTRATQPPPGVRHV